MVRLSAAIAPCRSMTTNCTTMTVPTGRLVSTPHPFGHRGERVAELCIRLGARDGEGGRREEGGEGGRRRKGVGEEGTSIPFLANSSARQSSRRHRSTATPAGSATTLKVRSRCSASDAVAPGSQGAASVGSVIPGGQTS